MGVSVSNEEVKQSNRTMPNPARRGRESAHYRCCRSPSTPLLDCTAAAGLCCCCCCCDCCCGCCFPSSSTSLLQMQHTCSSKRRIRQDWAAASKPERKAPQNFSSNACPASEEPASALPASRPAQQPACGRIWCSSHEHPTHGLLSWAGQAPLQAQAHLVALEPLGDALRVRVVLAQRQHLDRVLWLVLHPAVT